MVKGSLEKNLAANSLSPGRNRGWVWFFVLLVILTLGGITLNWWYNARQQLTLDRLAAARALWEQKGPRDYDLRWTKQINNVETLDVRVRGGKVVAVTLDGRPLEERLYPYYDMNGLFDFLEQFLHRDTQPDSPRAFAVATFHREDGHLLRYVRSVSATRERVAITTQLRPISGGTAATP